MSTPALVLRSYEALLDDVRPGERSVVARINTNAVDRYRSVIDPQGVRLDSYRKNPVVLWEHGADPVRGRLPIGRNVWIKARKQEGDLIAKTKFGDDEFSSRIFDLYQDGTLRSFSVGLIEDEGSTSPPTAAELRARPELAECLTMYRASDLCEYSSVAVAGNPEALALAVLRGLWVPDEIRASLVEVEELPPLPERIELPAFEGRRLADLIERRRLQVRAYGRGELEDLQARIDLARGKV